MHGKYCIASDSRARIHIYSFKHKRFRTFEGAGGTESYFILVKDNVLYQSCFEGDKQGIFLYKLRLEEINWFNQDKKQLELLKYIHV